MQGQYISKQKSKRDITGDEIEFEKNKHELLFKPNTNASKKTYDKAYITKQNENTVAIQRSLTKFSSELDQKFLAVQDFESMDSLIESMQEQQMQASVQSDIQYAEQFEFPHPYQ